MPSENLQGSLWIPCEFYSSLANQIMCIKQSALEYAFSGAHIKLGINRLLDPEGM